MNTRVHFQDYSTYMECTYDNVCMKIYYDDKSIVDVVMSTQIENVSKKVNY